MNSKQTPNVPPANANATEPTPSIEAGSSAGPGPHNVLLLGVAFGIALLVAAGVVFIILGDW
jgi:hypothetical protein